LKQLVSEGRQYWLNWLYCSEVQQIKIRFLDPFLLLSIFKVVRDWRGIKLGRMMLWIHLNTTLLIV